MQSKSLLIAIAAFAVTATGVHAYGGTKVLTRAGLSEEQVSAIERAQELRGMGNLTAARNKLAEAGVTEETLLSIRRAAKETKDSMRQALRDGDYYAFKEAVSDSPLGDIITSEADFEQYRKAYDLRVAGEWAEAHEILDELGVDVYKQRKHQRESRAGILQNLSDEQHQALMVARQANDHPTMQAIIDEAGVEFKRHHNK